MRKSLTIPWLLQVLRISTFPGRMNLVTAATSGIEGNCQNYNHYQNWWTCIVQKLDRVHDFNVRWCTEAHAHFILSDHCYNLRQQKRPSHIFVVHVLEESQFSIGALGMDGRLEGPWQLLDGHFVLVLLVKCRTAPEICHRHETMVPFYPSLTFSTT